MYVWHFRRNIPEGSRIKSCVYDPKTDPLCPIIKLGTIVKEAGEDYKSLAFKVECATNVRFDNDQMTHFKKLVKLFNVLIISSLLH